MYGDSDVRATGFIIERCLQRTRRHPHLFFIIIMRPVLRPPWSLCFWGQETIRLYVFRRRPCLLGFYRTKPNAMPVLLFTLCYLQFRMDTPWFIMWTYIKIIIGTQKHKLKLEQKCGRSMSHINLPTWVCCIMYFIVWWYFSITG